MTIERMTRRRFLSRSIAALAAFCARPGLAALGVSSVSDGAGNFKAVYLNVEARDRFYWFLQNVFHLYPEDELHQLIWDLTKEKATDREIYVELQKRLPALHAPLAPLTYDLPALRKQKVEMAKQALAFLGPAPKADGFMEVGSFGRYYSELKHRMEISGPVYILNDPEPSFSLSDMAERGGVLRPGTDVAMGDYDAFGPEKVPDASLDLVANYIGFHHAPPAKLDAFVASLRRALRVGGRMIVRDHDVDSAKMSSMVALAHDVFNAGVKLTWEQNAAQVRLFRSMRDWNAYLSARGFKRSPRLLAQDHDPTQNLLAEYVKIRA